MTQTRPWTAEEDSWIFTKSRNPHTPLTLIAQRIGRTVDEMQERLALLIEQQAQAQQEAEEKARELQRTSSPLNDQLPPGTIERLIETDPVAGRHLHLCAAYEQLGLSLAAFSQEVVARAPSQEEIEAVVQAALTQPASTASPATCITQALMHHFTLFSKYGHNTADTSHS